MPYLFLFTVSVFTNSKSFHSNKCDKLFIIFWCWDSNSLPFDRENLLPEPPDRLVPFDMTLLIHFIDQWTLLLLFVPIASCNFEHNSLLWLIIVSWNDLSVVDGSREKVKSEGYTH